MSCFIFGVLQNKVRAGGSEQGRTVPAGSSHTAQLPVEEDAAVKRLLMIRAQPLPQGGRHSTAPIHIRSHMFSLSRTLHNFWARWPSDLLCFSLVAYDSDFLMGIPLSPKGHPGLGFWPFST